MSFRRIVVGTAAMSAVRVLRLVAQFIAIPILSRLLSPEDYGVVAIAMPFALFAMMLADAGLGMSLVRTPMQARSVWSSSFWLTLMFGAALAAIMGLLAPVVAFVFETKVLMPMMLALAYVVLAQAVHLIPAAALQQSGKFNQLAVIEILSTAGGIASAVWMAYHGYGAWALIGQQVVFFTIRAVLSCWLSPFKIMFAFSWNEMREHVLFGRDVLGSNLAAYFSRAFDHWIIGKVLGAAALGFYTMAFQFARLPVMIVSGPLQFVMYPPLARMKDDVAAVGRVFLASTRLLALLIFPAMGLMAVAHRPIFELLLSAKWAMTGVLFMLTAPAAALQAVGAVGATVAYALGRSDLQLRTALEYCAVWFVALVIGVQFGLVAAAVFFTISGILYQLRYLQLLLPLVQLRMRDYFATLIAPVGATVAAAGVYWLLNQSIVMVVWQQVVLSAALAMVAMVGCAYWKRGLLRAEMQYWGTQKAAGLAAG